MKGKYEIWLTLGISCLFVMSPCAGHGASLTIGNTISMTDIDGVEIAAGSPVYVNSSGQLGTVTSSGIITVNCSATPPQSLQDAINAAQTGDTIQVTGTCNGGVTIPDEKLKLTLDGQNVATLHESNGDHNTLTVKGRAITIKNFTITGGHSGIVVQQGGTAIIDHNDVSGAMNPNDGAIDVVIFSQAVIINNNIHNNSGFGILVNESSSARIGFISYPFYPDDTPSPNTIQSNGGAGILVGELSNARITGNTIADNLQDGINVGKLSHANIANNTINGNIGNGINVSWNSGVNLGEDNPTTYIQQPNITTVNNGLYGINCSYGGYVRAHLGSTNPINGNSGPSSMDTSCPRSIVTP